jgi:hypothetical protein
MGSRPRSVLVTKLRKINRVRVLVVFHQSVTETKATNHTNWHKQLGGLLRLRSWLLIGRRTAYLDQAGHRSEIESQANR